VLYLKPPLTLEQQADLLLQRGMTGDRSLILGRLAVVNYYRLSGYWHTFRNLPGHAFQKNTTFEKVWDRYAFDRRLRLLVMDAIERVEIAVRAGLAYQHAHANPNPFAYSEDPSVLAGLRSDDRNRFLATLADELAGSKETFAEHFRNTYGDKHAYMPVWMATEIMTFGHVLTLYRGSSQPIKRAVAAPFKVHDTVLGSWLLTLNTIRNICAHHGRLWNRSLGVRPQIPIARNDPRWHDPVPVTNDRMFGILTILRHCLQCIAPQSGWASRFDALLNDYSYIPRGSMGFPSNWRECPIWTPTPTQNGGDDAK